MRLTSEIQIKTNNVVIGGPTPLICLPLVAKDKADLLEQAEALKALSPDLLEWRIDGFDAVESISECIDALKALKEAVSPIPVIFTCRTHEEGGMKELAAESRLHLILSAVETGLVDIIDTELCNEPSFIQNVKEATVKNGSRLILSYHNFETTPDETFLYDKLVNAQELGADIAKLAVMPKNNGDVLTLLNATYKARTGAVRTPIVTMSMGEAGGVTRIAGGLFGSDITFAVGQKTSAPGQIPIDKLKQAMAVLY